MWLQGAGRVVQQHAHCAEIRQLSGLFHEGIGFAGPPRAVDEAGLELAAGPRDGIRCLSQVRDVVERIVEPKDVDAVLGRTRDEPPDEVVVDRAGADEEASSERKAEGCLHMRPESADPLPRTLHPTPDRAVETAAARDLEIRKARPVQDLRDSQLFGRRQSPRERFLAE